MKMLETLRKLPQQELEIWQGGRTKLPFWIEEGGDLIRPVLEVWAHEESGGIVRHNLLTKMPSLNASLMSMIEAMMTPMFGPPRRPTHLRVTEKPFAEFLREKLSDAGIRVEVADRLDLVEQIVAGMA